MPLCFILIACTLPQPLLLKEREEIGVTEWDRFARQEYQRLADDDGEVEAVDAGGNTWGASALEVDL